MNGTRNAGVVYFQHCSVVLYGSPPVIVTTPTIRPAPAQVAATFSTASEPPSSALRKPEFQTLFRGEFFSKRSNAVSRRRKLVANETTVAQNTDSSGEKLKGGIMK